MSTKTKHTQAETIEYEYPDLGSVEIELQAESAEIYRFLKEGGFIKAGKGMGIEHFERLDQLGALRAVYKTAHHSRWEYMVLQMYLIQELKTNFAVGLSTSITLKSHKVTSLEELLKSWVLLNNYGHLLDTFEAERVWLELILEEPKLYRAFISCMSDGTSTKFAEEILKEESIYRFHHLVALALLGRLSKKKGLGDVLNESAGSAMVVVVGMPLSVDQRVFNCAVVLNSGRILGVIPETLLPSYKEFYEDRWFSPSADARSDTIELAGQRVPFGTDKPTSLMGLLWERATSLKLPWDGPPSPETISHITMSTYPYQRHSSAFSFGGSLTKSWLIPQHKRFCTVSLKPHFLRNC